MAHRPKLCSDGQQKKNQAYDAKFYRGAQIDVMWRSGKPVELRSGPGIKSVCSRKTVDSRSLHPQVLECFYTPLPYPNSTGAACDFSFSKPAEETGWKQNQQ